MKYLLMNLDADRMSFGYNSIANDRYTVDFPTKSALFGMICCAMGKKGELSELFGKLRQIKVEAFAMANSRVETDFQTIGNGWRELNIVFNDKNNFKGRKAINISDLMVEHTVDDKISTTCSSLINKDYLVNQHFIVVMEIADDAFANEIANALQNPVWQIYIGRKKCVPNDDVFYGIFDSREDAMKRVDGMNPIYRYSEDEPDDYLDEMNVRDVPMTRFNEYSTYTHRRVYKSDYKAVV